MLLTNFFGVILFLVLLYDGEARANVYKKRSYLSQTGDSPIHYPNADTQTPETATQAATRSTDAVNRFTYHKIGDNCCGDCKEMYGETSGETYSLGPCCEHACDKAYNDADAASACEVDCYKGLMCDGSPGNCADDTR